MLCCNSDDATALVCIVKLSQLLIRYYQIQIYEKKIYNAKVVIICVVFIELLLNNSKGGFDVA